MTNDLSQDLKRLHDDLAGAPPLNAEDIAALRRLADDIQRIIDSNPRVGKTQDVRAEADSPEEPSILDRISTYIETLEAQHPQLTKTLSMVAERLSDMGI